MATLKNGMKTKYAYIAGIIDGEGCIAIRKDNHKARYANIQYCLVVNITNTDIRMLEFVKDIFGGSISMRPYYKKDGCFRKKCWRIMIYSNQAYELLVKVKPYLVIKQEQADLAMKFQESIGISYENPLTLKTLEFREGLYQQLRSHHRRLAETECNGQMASVCDSPNLQETVRANGEIPLG